MAFQAVSGVPGEYCLVAIVLLGTVYTTLGGSRAVIWTDVAQALVFLFAFLVIGVVLLEHFNWEPRTIYSIASANISR